MAEKPLHQELLEARADVQRQIEILQVGPLAFAPGGGPQFQSAIAELEATLKEIDDAIADLGEDDA